MQVYNNLNIPGDDDIVNEQKQNDIINPSDMDYNEDDTIDTDHKEDDKEKGFKEGIKDDSDTDDKEDEVVNGD